MIFVTVGTHEQQFNRLIEYMDKWASEHDEKVVMQIGFSTYNPIFCEFKNILSYQKIIELIDEARIVITHGGPSSFILPLQIGKIPIVVPRKSEFNEHVNNHQVSFSKDVADRMGTIIVVEDVEDLGENIEKYNELIGGMGSCIKSNNTMFCYEFKKIVDRMFK